MKAKFKSLIQAIVGHLGACMEPLMPAIIAGGLIEFKDEVFQALNAGAAIISTGKAELWDE